MCGQCDGGVAFTEMVLYYVFVAGRWPARAFCLYATHICNSGGNDCLQKFCGYVTSTVGVVYNISFYKNPRAYARGTDQTLFLPDYAAFFISCFMPRRYLRSSSIGTSVPSRRSADQ